MANTNGFIKMAVGALVVIIVAAGVILPLFASAEVTAGDKITKSNEFGNYLYSDYSDSDLTITVTYDSVNGNSFTVNDDTYTSYAGQTVLIADNFSLNLAASSYSGNAGNYYSISYTDNVPSNRVYATIQDTLVLKYSHENGTITYTYGTAEPVTIETSTVMAIAANGNYIYVPANDVTSVYATQEYISSGKMGSFWYGNTVVVGSSTLICRIFVSGGEVYPFLFEQGRYNYVSDDYTVTFTIEGLTVADGTTDIYTGGQPTITVTNNDTQESGVINTNISGIVIKEVTGHATSGLNYTLVSILPVIILVGVLMMVVTAFISNRRA